MNAVCQDMPDGEPNEWLQSSRDPESKVVWIPQGRLTKDAFLKGIAYLIQSRGFLEPSDIEDLVSILGVMAYMCHASHIQSLTEDLVCIVQKKALSKEHFLLV
jgi:hypothetical protein